MEHTAQGSPWEHSEGTLSFEKIAFCKAGLKAKPLVNVESHARPVGCSLVAVGSILQGIGGGESKTPM